MVDRTIAPSSNKIEQIDFPKLSETKLENKIPLYSLQASNIEVCKLELVFEAGTWFEPSNGIAFFTIKSLLSGTKKKKASDLQELLDYNGAFSELNHGPDFSSLSIYCPKKNLDKIIHLINEVLFESTFPEDELVIKKQQKQQQILLEESKNNVIATKKFVEILFEPNHPYGRRITKEDLDKINREDLINFYNNYISNNSFSIFISGNFDETHLKLLNTTLGKPQIAKKEKQTYFPVDPRPAKEIIIQKPESNQSSVRLGKVIIRQSHEDFKKLKFVNTLLGGFFGSRLIKNIREEKGLTYGIYSNLVNYKNKAYFIISTEAKKESSELLVEECLKEIKRLKTKLIESEELITVKNYLLGALLRNMDSPFNIIEQNKKLILFNLNNTYMEDYFNTISTITSEECLRISNEYLLEKEFSKVIVG